ncbi:tetratricopeptide repeat protein, partial [Streptomyces sp. NPDC057681]|uniref:tetratricopeptide repeat protein n=1 Tax=Streptomyces sp. NPDC057681 TaxID=3346209 RepID=UPI0036977E95
RPPRLQRSDLTSPHIQPPRPPTRRTYAVRALAAERPDAFLPVLATSLNDLSKWLGALGRREEGLAAIEEAVTIRRELAVARPDAFLADLARSLYNLAIDLGELGRREEGLAAAEEAVAAYRQLAALRPDAFLPDLAASLNDLAIDLGALGRDEEGLAAVEEADALRATAELHLTLDRPENAEAAASALDQYASDSLDRARPLTALAESTGLQGRLVDAVGLALDAVRLYDHHAPLPPHRDIELAQTLCIVADLHSALGEHRKAEECAGRAAGIVYRQWLVDAPARYSLFMQVLHKLVAYAVDAADLAAAVEGAKLRVTAVRGHADAPLEELAGFLGELGSLQARHGAHVDAMATFTEAGELVSGCPYDRAVLDARRSSALHNLGRTTEAVQLSKYAIDLLSPVEKEPSHPLLPWLGHLHHDLSTYLKAEQRPREALREAEHAVSVYERVAADNPAEHREQLVSALTLAGALLDELGETEQARRMRMRLQDLPQDIGDSRIEAPVKDIRHIAAMLRRPR